MEDESITTTRAHWDGINDFLDQAPDWIDRGQAATVLNTVAIFEDVLSECVRGCMRPLSSKMRARLFDGYGPLSTFAAKTDIAYAIKLLTDEEYADLQTIRKVRNEFAHSREVIGFETPKIEAMVRRMHKPQTESDTAYRWYFGRLAEIGFQVIDAVATIQKSKRRRGKTTSKTNKKRTSTT